MPRIYPFINALRLSKNITYPLPDKENDNVSVVLISAWIELLNKYIKLDLPSYSPEDMIKRYILEEITIKENNKPIRFTDGDIEIENFVAASKNTRLSVKEEHVTTEYLKAFLYDDVVYDKADSWFTKYMIEPITKEILFHNKGKALWHRTFISSDENIISMCTDSFVKFCFDELKKKELYIISSVMQYRNLSMG